jgi:hypothetical protein
MVVVDSVWENLERMHPEFFKSYNIRLKIKEQITAFNYLISQQAQLLQKVNQISPLPYPGTTSSVSQIISLPPDPTFLSSIPTPPSLVEDEANSGMFLLRFLCFFSFRNPQIKRRKKNSNFDFFFYDF